MREESTHSTATHAGGVGALGLGTRADGHQDKTRSLLLEVLIDVGVSRRGPISTASGSERVAQQLAAPGCSRQAQPGGPLVDVNGMVQVPTW